MHNTVRDLDEVGLVQSFLNHKLLIVLVEVKIVHEVWREQIVYESDVCQVMRKTLDSPHKSPSHLLATYCGKVLAVSWFV